MLSGAAIVHAGRLTCKPQLGHSLLGLHICGHLPASANVFPKASPASQAKHQRAGLHCTQQPFSTPKWHIALNCKARPSAEDAPHLQHWILSHRCCPPGAQVTAAHRCSGLLGALEYPVCDHISPHSGGLISACSAKGCSPALDAQQGRPHHHQTSITAEACATLLACTGCSTDLAPPPSGRMAP